MTDGLADKLAQLERTLNGQIEEVEAELRALQQPTSLTTTGSAGSDSPGSKGSLPIPVSSHWEQVLAFVRQGQEEEAIFALVRVVQRLLDEKAFKRSLTEKASKSYVDSLFERVAKSVEDNLRQCTSESLAGLQGQIAEVKKKIADLRKFVQTELQDIQVQVEDLKHQKTRTDADEGDTVAGIPPKEMFVVHPNRQGP
jgi:hypothetical protein